MANRLLPPAANIGSFITESPSDPNVPAALLGMARSYFVERRYEEARQTLSELPASIRTRKKAARV